MRASEAFMRELTERELEIERLRETEGLSYRAIGERLGVTINRDSQIYDFVLRYRREKRRIEFYEAENQKTICFSLTLAEVVTLQRILSAYMFHETNKLRHTRANPELDALKTECIDFRTAGQIFLRLHDAETENRTPRDYDE